MTPLEIANNYLTELEANRDCLLPFYCSIDEDGCTAIAKEIIRQHEALIAAKEVIEFTKKDSHTWDCNELLIRNGWSHSKVCIRATEWLRKYGSDK